MKTFRIWFSTDNRIWSELYKFSSLEELLCEEWDYKITFIFEIKEILVYKGK